MPWTVLYKHMSYGAHYLKRSNLIKTKDLYVLLLSFIVYFTLKKAFVRIFVFIYSEIMIIKINLFLQ